MEYDLSNLQFVNNNKPILKRKSFLAIPAISTIIRYGLPENGIAKKFLHFKTNLLLFITY